MSLQASMAGARARLLFACFSDVRGFYSITILIIASCLQGFATNPLHKHSTTVLESTRGSANFVVDLTSLGKHLRVTGQGQVQDLPCGSGLSPAQSKGFLQV